MTWRKGIFGESIKSKLRSRVALDDDELYSRYALSKGYPKESWLKIWHQIARALDVCPGKLRAEDSFYSELSPEGGLLGCDSSLDYLNDWIDWWIPDGVEWHADTLGELMDLLLLYEAHEK